MLLKDLLAVLARPTAFEEMRRCAAGAALERTVFIFDLVMREGCCKASTCWWEQGKMEQKKKNYSHKTGKRKTGKPRQNLHEVIGYRVIDYRLMDHTVLGTLSIFYLHYFRELQ